MAEDTYYLFPRDAFETLIRRLPLADDECETLWAIARLAAAQAGAANPGDPMTHREPVVYDGPRNQIADLSGISGKKITQKIVPVLEYYGVLQADLKNTDGKKNGGVYVYRLLTDEIVRCPKPPADLDEYRRELRSRHRGRVLPKRVPVRQKSFDFDDAPAPVAP